MSDPHDYARRVRARPYGPEEFTAGGVTCWFHGPFAVLTLHGDGTSLTIRAAADDGTSTCAALAAMLTAAGEGRPAALPEPHHLVCEGRPPLPAPELLRLTVQPTPDGTSLTATLADCRVAAALSTSDTRLLAERLHRWASATAR
ncbi:hypothetical protein [Thermomonospora amylolytica]|uniref:hypothetical protein n=1 Tax=Thermomonospora amylolytica TaxID=1411117 RepID=UPI000E6C554C|nr:hypothetical protein [Thermomonospora amylolytica]